MNHCSFKSGKSCLTQRRRERNLTAVTVQQVLEKAEKTFDDAITPLIIYIKVGDRVGSKLARK